MGVAGAALYLCRAGLLAVHVRPQPKVLQVCRLLLHLIREGHHRLGGGSLQEKGVNHSQIHLQEHLGAGTHLGRLGLQGD